MLIDEELLNKVSGEAMKSPRLRMNFDLRNGKEDSSQRMLNALEKGTILPIHRHQTTSETVMVVRGSICESYYDDNGNVTDSFVLKSDGPNYGLNVPKGIWHSFEVLEPHTVILSVKDGKYHPLDECDVLNK